MQPNFTLVPDTSAPVAAMPVPAPMRLRKALVAPDGLVIALTDSDAQMRAALAQWRF